MSKKPEAGDVHEIAGGWITERKGTPIPGFLKLTYLGFGSFGLIYLFSYWLGETTHSTRGALVTEFNTLTEAPGAWWHFLLAAIIAVFLGGLWWFAFTAKDEE